ncbi:MAG: DNA-directed RNA polymerase subunit alpha [Patescibacteria group bacterium]
MAELNVVLPEKPRVIKETETGGQYEIDGLYPGYGHTLGNSLRRIILSSLPGAAITEVKIDGVQHEFSTISGVAEDVVTILLNLKRVRLSISSDEPQTLTLSGKGACALTAKNIEHGGQVEILNPDQIIANLTDKNASISIEMKARRGLGFVPKEVIEKERVDIGTITMDAIFTPIRRVNYEVENMRIGDRTDFNRLRISLETDGTIGPRKALEEAIRIMILQLKAVVGFVEEVEVPEAEKEEAPKEERRREIDPEILKTRVETLDLSARTINALTVSGVRTVGGLVRKREEDILDIDGLGTKGIQEIKKFLISIGTTLK